MSAHTALAVAALAGSLVLAFGATGRAVAVVALAASALEVAMAFGLLRVAVAGLPLGLALGLGLAIPGVIAWFRASGKAALTAATVVTLVGILQVTLHVATRV